MLLKMLFLQQMNNIDRNMEWLSAEGLPADLVRSLYAAGVTSRQVFLAVGVAGGIPCELYSFIDIQVMKKQYFMIENTTFHSASPFLCSFEHREIPPAETQNIENIIPAAVPARLDFYRAAGRVGCSQRPHLGDFPRVQVPGGGCPKPAAGRGGGNG